MFTVVYGYDREDAICTHLKRTTLKEQNGAYIFKIEAAEGEEVHVEMDDLGDVQRLIDSGQLQVQHGDQIILVEGGVSC